MTLDEFLRQFGSGLDQRFSLLGPGSPSSPGSWRAPCAPARCRWDSVWRPRQGHPRPSRGEAGGRSPPSFLGCSPI